jgi:hypothetical protein
MRDCGLFLLSCYLYLFVDVFALICNIPHEKSRGDFRKIGKKLRSDMYWLDWYSYYSA